MLIHNIAPLLQSSGTAVFFDDPCGVKKFFGSYGSTKLAQIALARSWQADTDKTGPIVKILTTAPMPTATRARFYPGEDRSDLRSCDSEAARIIATLDPLAAA